MFLYLTFNLEEKDAINYTLEPAEMFHSIIASTYLKVSGMAK